jgi:hypothetical protein
MTNTLFQRRRLHFLAVLIGFLLLLSGCNDDSKPSGPQAPVGGPVNTPSEAKRYYMNDNDHRTKVQNIRTH